MVKIGDVIENRLGTCVIKEVINQKRILVSFLDHCQEKWCSYYDLKRGLVKIQKPTIHGFGIVDIENVKGSDIEHLYERWRCMILRCYGKNQKVNHPWYKGVSVCEEWRYLSNFVKWATQFDWEGCELDKDLIVYGCKEYGPDTCCVIPRKLNTLIALQNTNNLLQGVSKDRTRNKFSATANNKQRRFDNELEAHLYWLEGYLSALKNFVLQDQRAANRLNFICSQIEDCLSVRKTFDSSLMKEVA